MEKIGLIAGNRKFPLIFAQSAREKNYQIIAIAIKGDTSRRLNKLVDKIYWLGLHEFERLLQIFKAEGVTKVVMAGQISPWRLFSNQVQKNPELKNLLDNIRDKKADTIFGSIAQRLSAAGLELVDSTLFMEDFIPQKGTLTKKEPDFTQWEDIYFGWDLAKAVACLDIGQAIAVKDKAVVAVEAFEGTDKLIRRSSRIVGAGISIIKVSKPKQDKRFDIPVVGLNTIKNLIKAKASCLAIEAGKTLFIDREASIRLADSKGIAIVAL